ncbi:hypothetical protein AVEN_266290-1 [Araneus ventricosus]|uniref:Uncharacterized protein n=1 Tax=Araneus ventricosus TaxID=182803 RepID=A0A4Y2EG86_ARAVE|nr:hypothetical protein AVEN_266290-1 [Araneus ventricosus]
MALIRRVRMVHELPLILMVVITIILSTDLPTTASHALTMLKLRYKINFMRALNSEQTHKRYLIWQFNVNIWKAYDSWYSNLPTAEGTRWKSLASGPRNYGFETRSWA